MLLPFEEIKTVKVKKSKALSTRFGESTGIFYGKILVHTRAGLFFIPLAVKRLEGMRSEN